MSNPSTSSPESGELPTDRERFLVALLEHAESEKWLDAEQVIDRFPPAKIMQSLKHEPELRAKVLVHATGGHEKIAAKKCVASATEDLELAISEGITDAAAVLEVFSIADRVNYLGADALWQLVVDHVGTDSERRHFIVELALEQKLCTLEDVFDGLTIDEITATLPPEELRAVVAHALREGRRGQRLDEERFLEVVPMRSLLGFLPQEHVWDRVIIQKLASPVGLLDAAPPKSSEPAVSEVKTKEPAAETAKEEPSDEDVAEAAEVEVEADEEGDIDVLVDADPVASRPPFEDAARARVVGKLGRIHRVPPRHERLTLANLLSLESMYAELGGCDSDDEREAVIRDSFPNDIQLRKTMLALIEALDPTIDVTEPVIRDADAAALIKVVIFEEKMRRERDARSAPPPPPRSRTTTAPPPPSRRSDVVPARARASVPPPPPSTRAVTPPPPPPRSRRSSSPPQAQSLRNNQTSLAELERELATRRVARVG